MSEPEKAEVPAKSRRDPAGLSSEYHKAHKQLMLWAAILFIWELVGVDLDKAKDAGGNVGAVVAALKSPQAVPWVLCVIVAYFSIKCSIEWAQCHVNRRRIVSARFDFISALMVAGAAIALYVGQALTHAQFANFLQDPGKASPAEIGFTAGATVTIFAAFLFAYFNSIPHRFDPPLLFGTVIAGYVSVNILLFGTIRRPFNWTFLMYGFLLGTILFSILSVVYSRLLPKNS